MNSDMNSNHVIEIFVAQTVTDLQEQFRVKKILHQPLLASIDISLKEALLKLGAEKVQFSLKPNDQFTLVATAFKDGIPKEISFLPNNSPDEGEAAHLEDAEIDDAFCVVSKTSINEDDTQIRWRWTRLTIRKEIEFTGELIDK
jgi:hypothetical protein